MDSRPPKTKAKRDGLYIHPKVSIKKQTKVSCASCIAGHRSGACDHYDRILLQIRAAGRPSTTCHHQASCGGSCLQQKAFIVADESPTWCQEHRSCIENWEFSERCPPYPVASAKSTKRKQRHDSPASTVSTTTPKNPENQSAPTRHMPLVTASSCCAIESTKSSQFPPLTSPTPIFAAAEAVATKASPTQPLSFWKDPGYGYGYAYPVSSGLNSTLHPAGFAQQTSTFSLPHVSVTEVSSGGYLNPALETTTSGDPTESWTSLYDTFPATFSFSPLDPLSSHAHNPFSQTTNIANPALDCLPIASSPLRQRVNSRPTRQQQTHPCPGNGFQCPCDENCRCDECYTHGRGFWTLPFTLSDAQPDFWDAQPSPPTEITAAAVEGAAESSSHSYSGIQVPKQHLHSCDLKQEDEEATAAFQPSKKDPFEIFDDWLV